MLDEPRLLAANPWMTRRPITVSEYHRMGEVGILGERDHIELIEGELVALSPIGSCHHGTVCLDPKPDGYATVKRVGRDGILEPDLLPRVRIPLATLFR